MYADPRHIRSDVVSIRITSENRKRLEQRAQQLRTQPGTLARDLIEAVLECDETCSKVMTILNF